MVEPHNYGRSVEASRAHAAEVWADIYEKLWPGCEPGKPVPPNTDLQRRGVDRRVLLPTEGLVVNVEEKLRFEDYGDIALEYWSNYESRMIGWVARHDMLCDFLLYAIKPAKRAHLLPWGPLRAAWVQFHREWVETFKRIEAPNDEHWQTGGIWYSRSVGVPPSVLTRAGVEIRTVYWG